MIRIEYFVVFEDVFPEFSGGENRDPENNFEKRLLTRIKKGLFVYYKR